MTSKRKVNACVLPHSSPLHSFPLLLSFSLHILFLQLPGLHYLTNEGRNIVDAKREKSYMLNEEFASFSDLAGMGNLKISIQDFLKLSSLSQISSSYLFTWVAFLS